MTTHSASLPPLSVNRSAPSGTRADPGLLIAAALLVTALIVDAAIVVAAHHAGLDFSAIAATTT